MSARELRRGGVLERVKAGAVRLGAAAQGLGISYRQVKRIYRGTAPEGANGLQHRSAGRQSNPATALDIREQALALVREKYSGAVVERFGPTLAAGHLASERRHGRRSRNAATLDAR